MFNNWLSRKKKSRKKKPPTNIFWIICKHARYKFFHHDQFQPNSLMSTGFIIFKNVTIGSSNGWLPHTTGKIPCYI